MSRHRATYVGLRRQFTGAVTLSRGTIAFQNMRRTVRGNALTVRSAGSVPVQKKIPLGTWNWRPLDCGKFIVSDYASALACNWRRDFAQPLSAIYPALMHIRFARVQALPFASDRNLRSVCRSRGPSEILADPLIDRDDRTSILLQGGRMSIRG